MTLKDAIDAITDQYSTRDAAKRPAMGGYVYVNKEYTPAATGDYQIVFRERDNDNGDPVDHAYTYIASTGKYTAAGTSEADAAVLIGELLGEMLADDWQTGKASDFENARTNAGGDVW